MILAQRDLLAEARAIAVQAQSFKLEIERLKLQLEKARRARFGQSSERGRQIVEQLELAIADLEETQAEVEAKAVIEAAAMPSRAPSSSGTRKPARRPLPDHLPRERIVYPSPCVCGKCGGTRLRMCGWPPRCKSFVWAMRDKSAACMCPAYIRRHAWPPAQMRSADRVHYKLSRSRRLQVCWVSRSRLSTIASSSHSAPFHHDRQDPACPCGRFLCCPVRLLPRHYCPDDSSHLVGQSDRSEFDWLAGDNPSQPAVREVLLAA